MEQTQKKKTAKPYSPEFREHAVRLAMEPCRRPRISPSPRTPGSAPSWPGLWPWPKRATLTVCRPSRQPARKQRQSDGPLPRPLRDRHHSPRAGSRMKITSGFPARSDWPDYPNRDRGIRCAGSPSSESASPLPRVRASTSACTMRSQHPAHEVTISQLLNQPNQRHYLVGHRHLRCRFQDSQPEPSLKTGSDRQRNPRPRAALPQELRARPPTPQHGTQPLQSALRPEATPVCRSTQHG